MPSFPATIFSGAVSMIIAVQLQITMVSTNTPSACVSPALTGVSHSAAAAAQGAEPEPASFENSPRLMPFIRTAPKPPETACLSPNASSKIRPKTAGMLPIFFRIINIVIAK